MILDLRLCSGCTHRFDQYSRLDRERLTQYYSANRDAFVTILRHRRTPILALYSNRFLLSWRYHPAKDNIIQVVHLPQTPQAPFPPVTLRQRLRKALRHPETPILLEALALAGSYVSYLLPIQLISNRY